MTQSLLNEKTGADRKEEKEEPLSAARKKEKKVPLVVITTGGSGGHIFPAETTMVELQKKGFRLVFMTDRRGKEFTGSLSGMKIYRLMAESVTGKNFFSKAAAAFKLGIGVMQALWLLCRLKPSLVIGFGGYASVPTGIAAEILGIPVMLHEQNAVLGRANRLLAKRAALVATAFEKTERIPEGVRSVYVGMPVRPVVLKHLPAPYPKREEGIFDLLVFGGSQGARFFGEFLPKALKGLPSELKKKIRITQQVRAENLEQVRGVYETGGFFEVVLAPFFSNMPELMAKAHLVVGRSGASTITELFAFGRPAILIPLPTSADNHQVKNAYFFTETGAGWMMTEAELTEESFRSRIKELIENPVLLEKASACALARKNTQAALKTAQAAEKIIKQGAFGKENKGQEAPNA